MTAVSDSADAIIAEITGAFAAWGHLDYGESISMREHMLQSAYFAELDGADDRLIVAALLHDFGHLICNLPTTTFAKGVDNGHEDVGADALAAWFDHDIVAAVRLHVAAKRYLCAANPAYREQLSPASIVTLKVQGGPMTDNEMRSFEQQAGHEMALRIRIYDDRGKLAELERPGLEHYLPMLRACLKS